MPSPTSGPLPDEVCVWHADVATLIPDTVGLLRAEALLGPADRDRYRAYRHDGDQRMFLAGRVLARTLVGRALDVAPEAWRWREGPHGCPEIAAPDTPFRFNLAHSAGLVACALANERNVGVDVEDLARRPVDVRVVARYCAPEEVRDIESRGQEGWHDRFLQYWTLKEAYLKARGLGIALPLSEIGFTIDGSEAQIAFRGSLAGTDDRWTFQLTRPTPRHVLAVAAAVRGLSPHITVAPFAPNRP